MSSSLSSFSSFFSSIFSSAAAAAAPAAAEGAVAPPENTAPPAPPPTMTWIQHYQQQQKQRIPSSPASRNLHTPPASPTMQMKTLKKNKRRSLFYQKTKEIPEQQPNWEWRKRRRKTQRRSLRPSTPSWWACVVTPRCYWRCLPD